ncbi:MAG TPA: hypothetical protein VI278_08675 [Nitrososphaeraceae archaeon]
MIVRKTRNGDGFIYIGPLSASPINEATEVLAPSIARVVDGTSWIYTPGCNNCGTIARQTLKKIRTIKVFLLALRFC